MTRPPMADAEVAGFADALGLPGLFDVHVHFLPPPIIARVWEYFDRAGPLTGRPWPITYREPDEERVARLRAMGVRTYSALPYAHKPGIAGFLNDWAAAFAKDHPDSLWSATFYAEPEAEAYVADLIGRGAEIFKAHVQVGGFDPADPLLDPVWGALADSGTPVVVHAGSGPMPGAHTGIEPMRKVLQRHPRLSAIIAHMGTPEYAEFMDLAERYDNVCLDTTMVFTDFTNAEAPYPPELMGRLRAMQPKVLLGSDFPNIPYPYAHQLEALVRLDLGDDWLRSVCWGNGARMFPRGAS